MNTAFPLIALAVAIVSLALSPPPDSKPEKPNFIAAIGVLLVVLIAGFVYKGDYHNLLPAALAFGAGVVIAAMMRFLEGFRVGTGATAAAIAATLAGISNWLDVAYMAEVQMALITGLAIGAWATGNFRTGAKLSLPVSTALLSAVFIGADFMGRKALTNETAALTGTMLGLSVSIAALLALVAGKNEKKLELGLIPAGIVVVVLLILGYVVGGRLLENQAAWLIFGGSVLAGAVLNWVIRPEGKDDSLAFLVGSVIWIGIATLSFSYLKGFGMVIAATGAVSTLLVLGNPRALLSTGPLVGLAFYRILRESHPDVTKALDLGQHYAVIGVAFGAVIALLPSEWLRTREANTGRFAIGRFLWALVTALIPVALAVVLGAKGMVGFVAGLGFAAFIEGLRNGTSLIPLALTGGLAALVAVSYGWLEKLLDLTRESKQVAFYWIAGVGVLLAVLISLVSKSQVEADSQ